jgi:hypothetical protein
MFMSWAPDGIITGASIASVDFVGVVIALDVSHGACIPEEVNPRGVHEPWTISVDASVIGTCKDVVELAHAVYVGNAA